MQRDFTHIACILTMVYSIDLKYDVYKINCFLMAKQLIFQMSLYFLVVEIIYKSYILYHNKHI